MPNWVFNTLTIQGNKSEIDYIKTRLNQPFTKIENNWDTEKWELVEGEYTYSNPVFCFHNIYNHIEDGVDVETYMSQRDHSQDLQEVLKYKGNNWYEWNIRNWGTKWDVPVNDNDNYSDTQLVEHKSEGEDQWLIYKFDTAWSPPVPAMQKLSKLVPNCVVTLSYEEEQGWGGEIEFVRGEITAESDYDSKCHDCDETNNIDYCEECGSSVCLSCKATQDEGICDHDSE